jgi:hypothetical protein
MFNIQFPLPENPLSLFEVTYETNDAINFCIWVLEQDGLQVPPFDQHPDGDGTLRSLLLSATDWQQWVTKIAVLLDYPFGWQVPEPEQAKQLIVAQVSQLLALAAEHAPEPGVSPLDVPAFVGQMEQRFHWQQAQYQKEKTVVEALYGDQTPPDPWHEGAISVWDGSPAIAARLQELHEVYPARQRQEAWMNFPTDPTTGEMDGRPETIVDMSNLRQRLQLNYEMLGSLKLRLVSYPYPVAWAIAPNTIVLSPSAKPEDAPMLEDRVVVAVEQLIQLNLTQ